MALASKKYKCFPLRSNDLETEKLLIWKTKIPFENEELESSHFLLMGLEWCLRFSYNVRYYGEWLHVISIHQVIDGKVSEPFCMGYSSRLKKPFCVKTSLMDPTELGCEEKSIRTEKVVKETELLWWAGNKKEDIYNILPNLYTRCEVKIVCKFYGQPSSAFQLQIKKEISVGRNQSIQVSSEVPPDIESVLCDFSNLLEKGILPDVKLECGSDIVHAHRSVLAARSKVFHAMFLNKMQESETGAIRFSDMDITVLHKFLKFIYTGKLEDLCEKDSADLYEAADKYDVPSLKTACRHWIIRNLTEENCLTYLEMAGARSDPDLKEAVISFIVQNSNVLKSEAWFTFLKTPSVLANEVFKACIDSNFYRK